MKMIHTDKRAARQVVEQARQALEQAEEQVDKARQAGQANKKEGVR